MATRPQTPPTVKGEPIKEIKRHCSAASIIVDAAALGT